MGRQIERYIDRYDKQIDVIDRQDRYMIVVERDITKSTS